jgi:adenosylcobinamide hydrolase
MEKNVLLKEKKINLALNEIEAKIVYLTYEEFTLNMLLVSFGEKRRVLSTRDGFKTVQFASNTYIHPGLLNRVSAKFEKHIPVTFEFELEKRLLDTLGIAYGEIALLNTAVDMKHLAVCEKSYKKFAVCCFATAGAKNNALRMGTDKGDWVERDGTYTLGTINIILLANVNLSEGAMARAIITATEAKTAALQDLDVRSTYSPKYQATGTGTDNIIIVSGNESCEPIQCSSGHTKMGELMAVSTKTAVTEALKKHDKRLHLRALFR